VQQPVEQGRGHDRVVEDLSPRPDRAVGRQDDRAFAVAAGDDLEQRRRGLAGQRQVAQLVDHQQLGGGEPRWATLARANLAHAVTQGATGRGQVRTTDPTNLAHTSTDRLLDAFQAILAACLPFLRPDGIVAIATRPWRRHGLLIDFPGQVAQIAEHAGLVALDRHVALLAGLRGDTLVPRCSFFQLDYVRKARHIGIPLRVIAHEDILVFRAPGPADDRAGAHRTQTRRDTRSSSPDRAPASPGAHDRARPAEGHRSAGRAGRAIHPLHPQSARPRRATVPRLTCHARARPAGVQ